VFIVFAAILGDAPDPTVDEREVQRLVRLARTGDGAAARRLYTLHAGRVFRAVRGLCGSEADAEDAVQETFARALPRLNEYGYRARTRFVAWLCTIAFNVARQKERATRRTGLLQDTALGSGRAVDPEGDLDRARQRGRVLTALAELEPRDREVVSLRYGAGLSAPEVGEALSLSPANVRKICERQRAALLERAFGALSPGEASEARIRTALAPVFDAPPRSLAAEWVEILRLRPVLHGALALGSATLLGATSPLVALPLALLRALG
jgi:RNA polymerase sigma-70 factor (ECF subfamily)